MTIYLNCIFCDSVGSQKSIYSEKVTEFEAISLLERDLFNFFRKPQLYRNSLSIFQYISNFPLTFANAESGPENKLYVLMKVFHSKVQGTYLLKLDCILKMTKKIEFDGHWTERSNFRR